MKTYTLLAVLTASLLVWNCKPHEELLENEVKPKPSSARVAAQPAPIKLWDAAFGGMGTDILETAVTMPDGGLILGGYSNSGISGNKKTPNIGWDDYWLVNLDPNGAKRGEQTIGGTGDDKLASVLMTTDGGYLLGGTSDSPKSPQFESLGVGYKSQNSRGYDFWIVKLGKLGNRLWDVSIGGSGDESLSTMVPTKDGGYLLGGTTNSPKDLPYPYNPNGVLSGTKGGTDFWVAKIDAKGYKLWDKSYGTANNESLKSIVPTADGGFLLAGMSLTMASWGDEVGNFWVIKIDANGIKQWEKTHKVGATIDPSCAISTADGGFLLGGSMNYLYISGNRKIYSPYYYGLIKLDSQGNKVWDKVIGSSVFNGQLVASGTPLKTKDLLTSLVATPDGGFLVGGSSNGDIQADKTEDSQWVDYWLVKVNAQGDILWDKTVGGESMDLDPRLVLTADGSILATGSTQSRTSQEQASGGYGNFDYGVIKLK